MKKIPEDIVQFLRNQGFVIVSTIDEKGMPHASCKGIVKISPNGRIYLLDLYRAATYHNLKRNRFLSITAVDEHKFRGYCLKGKASMIMDAEIKDEIIKAWEERITSRLTQRLLKNIREEKGHPRHPEILLPKPEYLIVMDVGEINDLTPHHIRLEG